MTDYTALNTGDGGETHQIADDEHPVLTTNHGMPISDNQNQLKAGARGPVLLDEEVYREKINHFDHERIPERIVHAPRLDPRAMRVLATQVADRLRPGGVLVLAHHRITFYDFVQHAEGIHRQFLRATGTSWRGRAVRRTARWEVLALSQLG